MVYYHLSIVTLEILFFPRPLRGRVHGSETNQGTRFHHHFYGYYNKHPWDALYPPNLSCSTTRVETVSGGQVVDFYKQPVAKFPRRARQAFQITIAQIVGLGACQPGADTTGYKTELIDQPVCRRRSRQRDPVFGSRQI